ncbi:MAG: peroxiredoxin-like family protein [Caldimonas sp.]
MNSLKRQLEETQAASLRRSTPERTAVFESATEQLRLSGVEGRALPVGAQMPEVALSDAMGEQVSLRELNARAPLVIVFYRGGWCPYCNLALREWQRLMPDLVRCGGRLVAISPQGPDQTLSTAEKNELAFTVLSDTELVAAKSFGVAFTLATDVVELYSQLGVDLPSINANGRWELPISATFVIDREGRVAFAHVEADYRQRAEPSEVLAIVEALPKAAS